MPNLLSPVQTIIHHINYCRWLCLLLIASLWAGCASSSRDLGHAASLKLKPGMTSAEVIKVLGKPEHTVSVDGQKTLAYYYSWRKDPRHTEPSTGYDGPTSVQLLSLRYDATGKLEEFLSSDGAIIGNLKIRGGAEAGTFVQELDVTKIVSQLTTLAELIARFGQPTSKSVSISQSPNYHWLFVDTAPSGSAKTQELLVSVDSANKVTQVITNGNLPLPINLLPLQSINTLQPNHFQRDTFPPKVPFFF